MEIVQAYQILNREGDVVKTLLGKKDALSFFNSTPDCMYVDPVWVYLKPETKTFKIIDIEEIKIRMESLEKLTEKQRDELQLTSEYLEAQRVMNTIQEL